MSLGNLISEQIPAATVAQIIQKYGEIDALLSPFFVNVTGVEKHGFSIVGEARIPFVNKGMLYIVSDPKYLSGNLDAVELQHDYQLFTDSRSILTPSAHLNQGVLNINNMAGSDTFFVLRMYYKSVKSAADQGDVRAKVIYDDLSQLFIKSAAAAPTTPTPPVPPATH